MTRCSWNQATSSQFGLSLSCVNLVLIKQHLLNLSKRKSDSCMQFLLCFLLCFSVCATVESRRRGIGELRIGAAEHNAKTVGSSVRRRSGEASVAAANLGFRLPSPLSSCLRNSSVHYCRSQLQTNISASLHHLPTATMNRFLPLLFLLLTTTLTAVKSSGLTASEASAAVSRFQEYLRIDTAQPTPDYAKAAAFITAQVESIGLESQTLELVAGKPLVLVKWSGKKKSLPSVLLNSHTDVVPSEPAKWDYHPFSASIDSEGRIYARGSQDMKCVGMQYLEAIRLLKKTGFSPERSIYLTFVPDEEIGGHAGVGAFVESQIFKDLNIGLVLDEGLASPGSEYRLFYGERSPWWTVIRAKGMPGHGAKLYDGSAMENLLKSVEAIRRFRTAQFDLVKAGIKAEGDVISINFVFLKAGTPSPTGFVMNLQPSEAEVGLDIRVPPSADPEALERRLAEEWAPSSRNLTYEFKQKVPIVDIYGKPAVTVADSSNPWFNLLEEAVKNAGGKLGKPEIFPASTDARYFRELGIPAFGFSPMANTPILLHDHNEFLSKDEYVKGIEIYESIIKALASYHGNTIDEESKAEL